MICEAKAILVPSQREIDDRTDDGGIRPQICAAFGRAAVEVGCPDENEPRTNAVDTIANVLHYLAEEGEENPLGVLESASMHFEAER